MSNSSHDCSWVYQGGVQCPHTGTISANITGSGPYYCAAHFAYRGRKETHDPVAVNEYMRRRSERLHDNRPLGLREDGGE